MTKLLVSVRSVAEAEAALAGGAALIDVKEPSRGSLGPADETTVAAVIGCVQQRRPVSAAMGELGAVAPPLRTRGLSYGKWGLAGRGSDVGWRKELAGTAGRLSRTDPSCQLVAVAYADWQRAHSPPPAEVCVFAQHQRCGAFLLDTWCKDGSTLLDWLSTAEIGRLCSICRAAGIPVALAGSLRLAHVPLLAPVQPDWFAVRGAVCRGGARGRELDPDAVRRWTDRLANSVNPVGTES